VPNHNIEQLPSYQLKMRLWQESDFIRAFLKAGNISDIPEVYHNEILFSLALRQDSSYFDYLPESERKGELAKLVLEKDGLYLRLVGLEHRTKELCEIAFKQNPQASYLVPLEYMPSETQKFFLKPEALNQQALLVKDLESIAKNHPEYLTAEGWSKVLDFDYTLIKNVPEELAAQILPWYAGSFNRLWSKQGDSPERIYDGLNAVLEKAIASGVITQKLCDWLVSLDGRLVQHIPSNFRSVKLLINAASQKRFTLQYLAVEEREAVVCTLALQQYPESLKFVPRAIRDKHPELIILALQKNGIVIDYLDEDEKPAFLDIAVESNGWAINFIPQTLWTTVLVEKAVTQSFTVLESIPFTHWNAKLLQIGLQRAIKADKTPELLLIIAKKLSVELNKRGLAQWSLEAAPDISALLTCTLQVLGLEVSSMSFETQLVELLTRALIADEDCEIAENLPAFLWTPSLIEAVLKQNGSALCHIPQNLWKPIWIKLALRQDGLILREIPESECTPEYCELAVNQNPLALEFVPEKYLTPELCLKAVKANPSVLQHVPDHGNPARGWSIDERFVEAVIDHFRPKTLFTPFFKSKELSLPDFKIEFGGAESPKSEPPAKKRRFNYQPSQ